MGCAGGREADLSGQGGDRVDFEQPGLHVLVDKKVDANKLKCCSCGCNRIPSCAEPHGLHTGGKSQACTGAALPIATSGENLALTMLGVVPGGHLLVHCRQLESAVMASCKNAKFPMENLQTELSACHHSQL